MPRVACLICSLLVVAAATQAPVTPQAPRPADDLRNLSLAIRQGDLAAVKALVEKNRALARSADAGGFTPLHIAATAGRVEIIEFLLQQGEEIERRTPGGQTPLFQTVPLVSQQAFRYLLSKGADIQARDSDGHTILEFALSWRRPAMIDLILKNGFVVEAKGSAAQRMLEEAADVGLETLVNTLLAQGVQADAGVRRGITLLHSAARGGLVAFGRLLLQRGARINERDQHGLTPLHVAAFHGRDNVVRFLFENGADIEARANDGRTSLHLAEYSGQKSTVALLAARGANRASASLPALTGPYLGQPEPGSIPEVFAPGIVSTEEHETNITFTPDGREWCFSRINTDQTRRWLVFMLQKSGRWTAPQRAPFSSGGADFEGAYSVDGRKLFFSSNRPLVKDGPAKSDMDLWVVERLAGGWGEPKNLGPAVNGPSSEYMPSVDRDGNLYFERYGLNMARWQNGEYSPAVRIDAGITNVTNLGHPFIAPDGGFLLYDARRPGSAKSVLFVSYRLNDGTWSQAIQLFEQADTLDYEACPTVSPDGRFVFFGRDHDIYWVSAAIIQRLRPAE